MLQPNADRPERRRDRGQPDLPRGRGLHARLRSRPRRRPREGAGAAPRASTESTWWPGSPMPTGARRSGTAVGLPTGPTTVGAVVERDGHELRFRPGGQLRDARGIALGGRGEPEAARRRPHRRPLREPRSTRTRLARLWSALTSPHAGDVLISAADGYECVDWGGVSHAGGGSHGALSREDSLAPLLFVGCGPERPERAARGRCATSLRRSSSTSGSTAEAAA